MLDFADEGNLVGKWGGHFGNWEGSVDLTSSLAEYEKDFEDLKMNLVDSKVDLIYFVGLGVNLTDLGMHFLDLKMCFEDLGMYSKMDFVGLEMDFADDTNNEKDKPVTLLKIKENLKDNSLSKLRSLAFMLIDSLDDLVKDKENLKETLETETVKKVVKLVEKLVIRKWDGKVYAHNKRLMFSDILVVGMGNGAMRVLGYVECGFSTM
ncbi:hypothetical protein BC332_27531 [Capsicum chinense]|nr:hypothetical protein BC332_27531 [Capsicum chinense]